jgi:CubicO group peptidase (beta-lactamase class C family)
MKTHKGIVEKICAGLLAGIALMSSFSGAVFAAEEETDITTGLEEGAIVTPTGIRADTIEQEVDAVMAPFIGETCPGAAVIVIKDNNIVLSKGYGYADIASQTPVDPKTTVFEWGSVSKLFVWTAAMQLYDKGLLDLNAPISQYLPEEFVKKLNLKYEVTMLDLMNHRAGFEEVYYDVITSEKSGAVELSEALLNYIPHQVFKPGTVSAYSNYSAALAAYVVECVARESFVSYVHENILTPLEMDRTGLEQDLSDKPEILDQKANGYYLDENGDFSVGGSSYLNLYPAGAMNGTTEDLAKFAMELMSDESRLFENQSAQDEMLSTSYRDTDELSGCAHGFWEYTGQTTGYGHAGNTNAFSSYMMVFPEEKFAIVALTNVESEKKVISGLCELLMGKQRLVDLPETDTLPDVAEFAGGTYVGARMNFTAPIIGLLNMSSMMTVEKTGDQTIDLVSVFAPSDRFSYVQTSPGVFTATGSDEIAAKLCFMRENGQIIAISKGTDTDLVPLSSVSNWSREKVLISYWVLAVTAIFCLISLPVYIITAVVELLRKPDSSRSLSAESRRLRFAGRLAVITGFLSLVNVFVYLYRMQELGDMTKITTNFHSGISILLLILFVVAVARQVFLVIRQGNDIKRSVAIKSILSTLLIALTYVVLALSNIFAII